jgi:hypothetical protein
MAKNKKEVAPYSSGEDSDENFQEYKYVKPSVVDVIERMVDSYAYKTINFEQARQYSRSDKIPVWLQFQNLDRSFNSFKFEVYISKIIKKR